MPLSLSQALCVIELKRAAVLVHSRPPVRLPRDPKRRSARLLALLAAERRRNAAIVATLEDR
jgi:hypothetical protein